ncbi:STAS/SEC14 domain-containing protein [Endozoicomonas atrinae]|uniref:STAS/SEC14 domain-containing protein n=1 Tax=Endozoicomonas atrinae TaxID=1333660 RepID=UPI000825C398|nr:STAS/SEC14 domain-containing protein [Endozoicomonas atrinae]
MLTITPHSHNRIDLSLNGQLDAEQMSKAIDQFVEKTKNIKQGTMLYRIEALHMPTLGAMGIKLSQLPRAFSAFRRFSRIAVLSNTQWVRNVSEIEGMLFPGMEIKAFALSEQAVAEQWLDAISD